MDPGSHVSKAAAADREGVSEGRCERIGLRNPFEDSAVGVEQGQKAVGRRVRLFFDAFGIDPADGLIAGVFKEDGIVKGGQRARA